MSKANHLKHIKKKRNAKVAPVSNEISFTPPDEKPISISRKNVKAVGNLVRENIDQVVYHQRARRELYWMLVMGRLLKPGDTTCLPRRRRQWLAKPGYEDSVLLGHFDISYEGLDKAPRDHAFHMVLREDLGWHHVEKNEIPSDMYYSRELYSKDDATTDEMTADIYAAREVIRKAIVEMSARFALYDINQLEKVMDDTEESVEIIPRPPQKNMVDRFLNALKQDRKYLLCAAPPRFGKSITTLLCAEANGMELVLVASAKVDVKAEWRKTVRKVLNFRDWVFLDREDLAHNPSAIAEARAASKKVLVFVSLPDIGGKDAKPIHAEIYSTTWDMLVVDEAHFGALAPVFGAKVNVPVYDDENEAKEHQKARQEFAELEANLKFRCRLDLSGTPYDILMSGMFPSNAIVYNGSYEDIILARDAWDLEHMDDPDYDETQNPYYDFPDLVAFGWALSNMDKKTYDKMEKNGLLNFKNLFEAKDGKFVHENKVIAFMRAFDGTSKKSGVYSILGNDGFKSKVDVVHAVMVLPSIEACMAMDKLLCERGDEFDTWKDYVPYLLTTKNQSSLPDVTDVQNFVSTMEKREQNTLCLTVDRMLTGVTVPEWNVMIYAKGCQSAQAYEQAKCRILSPYSVILEDGTKKLMKTQGIFIDCMPERMFEMEEIKAIAACRAATDNISTRLVEEQMKKNLCAVSFVMVDAMNGHIKQMEFTDVKRAITDYNAKKSLAEQMNPIKFNSEMFENPDIMATIMNFEAIDSKKPSITLPAFKDSDFDVDDIDALEDYLESLEDNSLEEQTISEPKDEEAIVDKQDEQDDERSDLEKRMASMMSNLALSGFVSGNERFTNLDELIRLCADKRRTKLRRNLANLGISMEALVAIARTMSGAYRYSFESVMANMNELRHDETKTPLEKLKELTGKVIKLGESDFITPDDIVSRMVRTISKKEMKRIIKNNGKILCLAEEAAEFSLVFAMYMGELGFGQKTIRRTILSLPGNPLARALTKEMYLIIGLPEHNIAEHFDVGDVHATLVASKKDGGFAKDYKKIAYALKATESGHFADVTLVDKQGEDGYDMIDFKAVVGNPPYQEGKDGRQDDKAIYHHFFNIGKELSDKVVLITKAGYLYNSGKGFGNFTQEVLNDPHFSVLEYWEDGSKVFPSTEIKGGVAIGCYDANSESAPIGFFSQYKEMNSVLKKVKAFNEPTLDTIHYSNSSCKYSDLFKKERADLIEQLPTGSRRHLVSGVFDLFPEAFLAEKPDDEHEYGIVMGRGNGQRTSRYMRRDYFNPADNYDGYKVWLPKANAGGKFGEKYAPVIVGHPGETSTETYFSHGNWRTIEEAQNYEKYYKTKFYRALSGTLKVTQNSSSAKIWVNVPLQDFTENSDIDWSKSIPEIDQQLYEKYSFDEEEIAFIETNVKEMK